LLTAGFSLPVRTIPFWNNRSKMGTFCCANLEIVRQYFHLSYLNSIFIQVKPSATPLHPGWLPLSGLYIVKKKKPAVVVAGYGKERVQGFLKGIY